MTTKDTAINRLGRTTAEVNHTGFTLRFQKREELVT